MKLYFLVFILILSLTSIRCSSSPRYRKDKTGLIKRAAAKKISPSSKKMVLKGKASYYGSKFHGKKTANGEIFDMYKISAAHKTLPFNTKLRVTNLSNGKSVIVKVNDRGPFVKNRILDLSYAAAKKIELIEKGVAEVKIEILEWGQE